MVQLLKVTNLHVSSKEKEIIKGVDFEMKSGEIQALLGPNASGKSTFGHSIAGDPKFKITKGRIIFAGKDITKISPEKRVKLGIVLSWQAPPAISGIPLFRMIERIKRRSVSQKNLEFGKKLFLREINVNFSGGERKISELMQIISLKPRLVIFDEIDSGLDIKKIQEVSEIIKKELVKKGVSVLLITHSGEILNFLKPSVTNIMVRGRIVCRAKDYKKVLKVVKRYGYEKCKKCKLFTGRRDS